MVRQEQLGLRTWTKLGISRHALAEGETIKIPMGVTTSPGTLSVNMNEDIQKIMTKSCKGQMVVAFTYANGIQPEVNLECDVAPPDWDTFVHGRIMKSATTVDGFVFFELDATKTTFPARTAGESGFGVTALTPEENTEIYYIDPETKLPQVIEVVSSTPTGDQIIVGTNLAITLSPELAASGHRIQGWVPCTFTKATIMSADLLDTVEIKAQGVDFNDKIAGFQARYCSRLAGGQLNQEPKRQANFQILNDPNDGNGTGFRMFYPDLEAVC